MDSLYVFTINDGHRKKIYRVDLTLFGLGYDKLSLLMIFFLSCILYFLSLLCSLSIICFIILYFQSLCLCPSLITLLSISNMHTHTHTHNVTFISFKERSLQFLALRNLGLPMID